MSMRRRTASAFFDTNVWGGIVSRISRDDVAALRAHLDANGTSLWMAPNTLLELSFRPDLQRHLLVERVTVLAQATLLRKPCDIVIDEFLMEMLRLDPAGLRGRLKLPSLEIESDWPLASAMRLLTHPTREVQEAAEREKLIRMLNQDRYKRQVTLPTEDAAQGAKTEYDRWHALPIEELRAIVPKEPAKSHPLLHEIASAEPNGLAEKIDTGVRDGLYYNFMQPVMTRDHTMNTAATEISAFYPPARHRSYWEHFHQRMDPRRLPGFWLNLAVATLQLNPARFDPKGSDHFDSEMATYCKALDIVVTADQDFAAFLMHPMVQNFLAAQGRSLRVVAVAPTPESLPIVIAGVAA